MTLEYQLSALMPYFFYGTWPLILLWEVLIPLRKGEQPLLARWSGNLGLYAINMVWSRVAAAVLGVGIVTFANGHGFGLLNRAGLPLALLIPGGVLLIDLSTYGFHVLSHKLSWLWRLHRVHHTDPEIDLSTNFRHHPLESVVGTLFAAGVALLAGFPPEALVISQLLSLAVEPLSHGNVRLPKALDRILRAVVVTPAMHRVHHSAARLETDSNYASIFSFWDRLFGTYVAAPALGDAHMVMGLETFRGVEYARLPGALAVPFL